jgi:hypothetical protein
MPSRSDPGNGSASGLDQGLRDRVKQQIERFDKALDAAMAAPTSEALDELSEAADQLMRATGRVLIEAARLLASKRPAP